MAELLQNGEDIVDLFLNTGNSFGLLLSDGSIPDLDSPDQRHFLDNEETVCASDINMKTEIFEEALPVPLEPIYRPQPMGPPSRDIFSGELNFEVQVNGHDTDRKKYLYSHKLNRIYVDRNTGFPMRFRWDYERSMRPLSVRATVIFSDPGQAEKRVERCLQHVNDTSEILAGHDSSLVHHVLRSSRPAGADDVTYCGSPADQRSWYSVLVAFPPRPPPGSHAFPHAYMFACKNSCSSGINRRAIELLFTLEDELGQVLGRQSVSVRACSCPKRDMKNDEEQAAAGGGKRPVRRARPHPGAGADADADSPAARRQRTLPDTEVITFSKLKVVGRKNAIAGLTMLLKYMKADSAENVDPQMQPVYEENINNMKSTLDKISNHS